MRSTASLRRKILSRRARVAVIGQEYAGLTFACVIADTGFSVTGIDADADRVGELRSAKQTVPGVLDATFRSGVDSGNLVFESSADTIETSDVIVVCVNPAVRDRSPDLTFARDACKEVASQLQLGTLVVIASMAHPGATEEVLRPVLEESGLLAGKDFLLAYSPERIDTGSSIFGFHQVPRVVGGLTPESTGLAGLFFNQFVDNVVTVSSCRAAEASKFFESSFRHVNVALVNELAMLCEEMGLDVWEVIAATATKPFGFVPFYPGPGVGGHRVPFAPGGRFRILEQAQAVNAEMPSYVVHRIARALGDCGKSIAGSDLLVLGVAYKAGVGDIRESPSLELIDVLQNQGASVTFHDPFMQSFPATADLPPRIELSTKALASADCVLLLTPHPNYDLDWIAEHAKLVFDARNAFGDERRANVVRL